MEQESDDFGVQVEKKGGATDSARSRGKEEKACEIM